MLDNPVAKRTAIGAGIGALIAIPVPFVGPIFGELNLSKMSAFQDANGWLLLPFWGEGLCLSRWLLLIPLGLTLLVASLREAKS